MFYSSLTLILIGDQSSLYSNNDLSGLFSSPSEILVALHKFLQSSLFSSIATTYPFNSFVDIAVSEDDLDTNTIPLHRYNGCTQIINIKLSVEGLSLDNLSIINKFSSVFSTTEIKFPLIELNASNNNLKDDSLENIFKTSTNRNQSFCFDTQVLQRLNLSSNQLSSMLNICGLSTHTLLSLDVSFCEDLVIEPNSFVFCPQLRELHMDSCNISSTVHADLKGPARSIFFGLVRLEELSLKENSLEDIESCEGLFYFGFGFFESDDTAGPVAVPVHVPSSVVPTPEQAPNPVPVVPVDKKAIQTPTSKPDTTTSAASKAANKSKSKEGAKSSSSNSSSSSSSSSRNTNNKSTNKAGTSAIPLSQPSSSASLSISTPVVENYNAPAVSIGTVKKDITTTSDTVEGSTVSSQPPTLLELPPSTLKLLFLRDNPVHSSLSLRRTLKPLLVQRIPSINHLDDEALRPSVSSNPTTSDRDINRQLLRRREADDQRTDLTGPLGPGGLDSMEREYLAALKGEKDNTVIS